MSYDLYMLRPVPGEEAMDTVQRLEERESPASPDRAVVERIRRIADALLALHPAYEESELDDGFGGPQLALMDAEGVDVTLAAEHAWLNFPYWESLDAARLTQEIERAANVIAQETGWALYDPQLERFIDPAQDASELREMFEVGVGHVQRITAEGEAAPPAGRRPSLWKRLRGGGP